MFYYMNKYLLISLKVDIIILKLVRFINRFGFKIYIFYLCFWNICSDVKLFMILKYEWVDLREWNCESLYKKKFDNIYIIFREYFE